MSRSDEITLLPNPTYHTMRHNGYIKDINEQMVINNSNNRSLVWINYNKESFN